MVDINPSINRVRFGIVLLSDYLVDDPNKKKNLPARVQKDPLLEKILEKKINQLPQVKEHISLDLKEMSGVAHYYLLKYSKSKTKKNYCAAEEALQILEDGLKTTRDYIDRWYNLTTCLESYINYHPEKHSFKIRSLKKIRKVIYDLRENNLNCLAKKEFYDARLKIDEIYSVQTLNPVLSYFNRSLLNVSKLLESVSFIRTSLSQTKIVHPKYIGVLEQMYGVLRSKTGFDEFPVLRGKI